MTIKHLGGIFGRNPTFDDITTEGSITMDGDAKLSITGANSGTDVAIDATFNANRAGIMLGYQAVIPRRGETTGTDLTDIGNNTNRFRNLYLSQEVFATVGTINTSDQNEKRDIRDITDAEFRVAQKLKSKLKAFRFNSAYEEKGEEARVHFGIMAQDIQTSFEEEGLDANTYAMFCSNTWTDEDGTEKTVLGVRYSELLAFIISAI